MQKQSTFASSKNQSAAKTPVAPSAPKPIDPALLRHVSGGTDSAGPTKGW